MPIVRLNQSLTNNTFVDDAKNPSWNQSDVIMLGVACDLTASYNKGTWLGPQAILNASHQIEFEVPIFHQALTNKILIHNRGIIETPRSVSKTGKEINHAHAKIVNWMKQMVSLTEKETVNAIQEKKLLMLFGGEHSVPNGVWNALEKNYNPTEVMILQFDAHLDLRNEYHETSLSHASIMRRARDKGFNVIQVGPRDHISDEEVQYIQQQKISNSIYFSATNPEIVYQENSQTIRDKKVISYENLIWNGELTERQYQSIENQVKKIKHLWISIDVDGLDASDIPGTGTPLPFGLKRSTLRTLLYRVIQVAKKNKVQIIGFDINEVSPQMKGNPSLYDPLQSITTVSEMDAALLAYYILFWIYFERFKDNHII